MIIEFVAAGLHNIRHLENERKCLFRTFYIEIGCQAFQLIEILFGKSPVDGVTQHLPGDFSADEKINLATLKPLGKQSSHLPLFIAEITGYFQVQIELFAVKCLDLYGELSPGNIKYGFPIAGHGFDHNLIF